MKRLFVFGCSYTAYSWPSWADLLSCEYDHFENWGMAGLGNRAICERLAECHVKHNFNKDDTIIIQWSTHLRNDFFHQSGTLTERVPGWKTAGSVFNYLNEPIYDRKWLETFFDEEAFFMHTLHHIMLAQHLLESTGAKWYMTSIGDLRELGSDIDITTTYGEQSLFTRIKDRFAKQKEKHFAYRVTPSLKIYNDPIWTDRADHWVQPIGSWIMQNIKDPFYVFKDELGESFIDHHPKPSAHLEWLVKFLIPKLGIDPQLERYNGISKQSDALQAKNINNEKKNFEKLLFREKFDLPLWPNMIKGFVTF